MEVLTDFENSVSDPECQLSEGRAFQLFILLLDSAPKIILAQDSTCHKHLLKNIVHVAGYKGVTQ